MNIMGYYTFEHLVCILDLDEIQNITQFVTSLNTVRFLHSQLLETVSAADWVDLSIKHQ